MLSMPLIDMKTEDVVGCLQVLNKQDAMGQPEGQSFDDTDLHLAKSFASIVADLEVLGSCDAIVGTAASWVSRLIFLLIIGETGRTPPHVFLDQRFGGPADVW